MAKDKNKDNPLVSKAKARMEDSTLTPGDSLKVANATSLDSIAASLADSGNFDSMSVSLDSIAKNLVNIVTGLAGLKKAIEDQTKALTPKTV